MTIILILVIILIIDKAVGYYEKLKPTCVDSGISYEESLRARVRPVQFPRLSNVRSLDAKPSNGRCKEPNCSFGLREFG